LILLKLDAFGYDFINRAPIQYMITNFQICDVALKNILLSQKDVLDVTKLAN